MATAGTVKQVKIVILGDSGVGKSCIMHRFVTGNFHNQSEPTLGGAFMAKVVNQNGTQIKYQIWDTAGQEKYHSLAPMYYRDAQIAILVYDITKKDSFKSLKKWTTELKENGPKNLMIAVVGNKIDLYEQEEVKPDEGLQFAKESDALFKTSSAKQDKGINELFEALGDELCKRETDQEEREALQLNKAQKQKKCCAN